MELSTQQVKAFQHKIWSFYEQFGRSFPWRNIEDPYKVLVSELMLQQTQTYRVLPKYEQFIAAFPSFEFLAQATLHAVLTEWQGLGYNRRGKYLHELAQQVMNTFDGILPSDPNKLINLPGIGPATAASITAFAFNKPTVFIETNIRTVFIHSFFQNKDMVHDKAIVPLVAQTVDHDNPREWYYALMDYGVMLKQTIVNPSRKSAHYNRQSKFEGSDRQIRGMIIRILTERKIVALDTLFLLIPREKERVVTILEQLIKEELVQKKGLNVTWFRYM
jgi:A/G-specific adenine glycosylase